MKVKVSRLSRGLRPICSLPYIVRILSLYVCTYMPKTFQKLIFFRGRCHDHNFLKNQCYVQFFSKTSGSLSNKCLYFRRKIWRKYLKNHNIVPWKYSIVLTFPVSHKQWTLRLSENAAKSKRSFRYLD
jgi:hypothetical protein